MMIDTTIVPFVDRKHPTLPHKTMKAAKAMKTPPAKTCKTSSISVILKAVIKDFEETKPQNISVMSISREQNIQHRRLYDFFNVLTSLGACTVVERGRIAWEGLGKIEQTLMEMYAQIEVSSITEGQAEIFNAGTSPSLGTLALNFIGLFFFLGVDVLSMRKAAKIFYDNRSDIRSLERRLYLVLNYLEIINIISRTTKTSQYRLMLNRERIVQYALYVRQNELSRKMVFSVETLLNRVEPVYMNSLYIKRQEEFQKIISEIVTN